MKSDVVEKWVWGLIYVGMAFGMLGLWAGDAPVAYGLTVLGGVMVATGVLLVWVRSRMGKRDAGPGAPR